jgi:hypothetical protein
MGSKTRKARCTTLYVCDSNTEERSISFDRSWAYFLVRFWGFEARTKNEYTMDDFSTLTIREPWLLKRISASTVSTWLAEKRIDATRSSRFTAGDQFDRDFQKIITKKGRLKTEFHKLLYERWLQVGTSRNSLAHTFTYLANFEVLTTRCFESVILFKLMQCICLCGMVLMMHVRMTRLPICVSDLQG